MVTSPKDISWGSYKTYEGPFYRGSLRYALPEDPSEDDRRLRVLTAVEGGTYDAINMYDRCIVSVGLIQWCEARYYLVSRMLHNVAEELGDDAVLAPLRPALDLCCADFRKNTKGQRRFHLRTGEEVSTLEAQQQLFLGCDGHKGSWSATSRMRAMLWAACFANIWQDPEARRVQDAYTSARLTGFVMRESRVILWDGNVGDDGWPGALRAAYISYAANLPTVANKHLQIAVGRLKSPRWSGTWCTGVLRELTFGPGIAIYPHRYDAIRPWLEELWKGVELPKTAEELKLWREPPPEEWDDPPEQPAPPPTPVEKDDAEVNDEKEEVPPVEEKQLAETKKVQAPAGILAFILWMLQRFMGLFTGRKG